MKKVLFALTSISAIASMAAPASAALIEKNFVVAGHGSPGPFSSLKIDFNISFDNTSNINTTTSGFVVLDGPDGYNLKYAYTQASDVLIIGTDIGINQINLNYLKKDLGFALFAASSAAPKADLFNYAAGGQIYRTSNLTVVSKDLTAAVPEPATWALMILGFGAVGYAMRRRHKVAVRFA